MLISYRIKEREGDEAMGRKRIGILLIFFLFLSKKKRSRLRRLRGVRRENEHIVQLRYKMQH